ncbi:MAG: glycosyltransferase [Candidatus Omnitrophota bacterium]|nr:glycosyltransferase [Candidatus Omnitrophota bacterium]
MQARIGYDSSGIMALKWHLDKRRFTVHHYHDYLGYGERERLWSGVQDIMAARRSQGANLVVVPDKHRKEFMQNLTPLKNARIEVVNNCPRRVEVLPRGRLRRDLRKLGVDAKHIVFFQGVVCSNYYAERIVESVRWWPDDAVMVFLGRVDESFRRELAVIAGRAGVSKRVIFLGHLTYKNVFSYTVDADLAFGMPKPVSLNFKYMAGASNKRFEYMACGVPQISNAEPGVKELIDLNGIGVSVNAEKPRDIAEAVKGLLGDEKRRRTMSEKARKLHLTLYNYDVQYRPVLDAILGGTSLKRVGRS